VETEDTMGTEEMVDTEETPDRRTLRIMVTTGPSPGGMKTKDTTKEENRTPEEEDSHTGDAQQDRKI